MISALLLALAFQGQPGSEAQAQAPAPEPTIMIVEFPRGARLIGVPQHCDTGGTLCFAELYEGQAEIVRHLSGPPVGRNARLRWTALARRWPAGMRMLVATRPFEDQGVTGNFALWWDLPADGDDYCMTTEDMARSGDNEITRRFANGYARRFRPRGYSQRAEFRCIRS
jgi:hypothetical protein